MRMLPGSPGPFGARWDGEAVDFALFSGHASRVELCLFDGPGAGVETARLELLERTGDVWHGRLEGIRPGQRYGYRVHGPWAPADGHRFNPAKLLVDPYARALHGELRWDDALLGHDPADPARPNERDSAPFVPKSVVVDPAPGRRGDPAPATPWSRTVLYECHVKGMTARHARVPAPARGRFAGLADPAVIEHLHALGVTAVELLPVQHSVADEYLHARGLPNYWGYSTLGFFAPDLRFGADPAPGAVVEEFRAMVRRLHAAGIEVILDVVYNHTPEGGPLGPTLSLRGIDNRSYYRLYENDPSQYADFTGCGNTLDTTHPRVLQLVLDSLRYWTSEMHVDGFRFDLAAAIAREDVQFAPAGAFFQTVQQDPVLAGSKLIAEPWDLGPEGYRLGAFPLGWSEWNDRFRDTTRRIWRGDRGQLAELAGRITGSSDLFAWNGRRATASINYVCSHDGFTLRDLVSYARKHNEANREGSRDGHHDESHNWGVEGPSRDRRIVRMRERARRNLTATSAFALGVPMWQGGDEIGRTQRGNNNAYCQDNEISWLDWEIDPSEAEFLDFVRHCFAVRAGNALFRRLRHLDGIDPRLASWHRPDGAPMEKEDWDGDAPQCLAFYLDADAGEPVDEAGVEQASRSVVLLLNAEPRTHSFRVPVAPRGGAWVEVVNTACGHHERTIRGDHVRLAAHSLVLLEEQPE